MYFKGAREVVLDYVREICYWSPSHISIFDGKCKEKQQDLYLFSLVNFGGKL